MRPRSGSWASVICARRWRAAGCAAGHSANALPPFPGRWRIAHLRVELCDARCLLRQLQDRSDFLAVPLFDPLPRLGVLCPSTPPSTASVSILACGLHRGTSRHNGAHMVLTKRTASSTASSRHGPRWLDAFAGNPSATELAGIKENAWGDAPRPRATVQARGRRAQPPAGPRWRENCRTLGEIAREPG